MKGAYDSQLFEGLTVEEVDCLLDGRHQLKRYHAGEIIAIQGTLYRSLLIVDEGKVRGEMINWAGDRVVIEELNTPRLVAPAILFASDNRLPVDVVAAIETNILAISMPDFTILLQQDERLLRNFLRSISDRSKFLSDRVRVLSFGTIKSKLAVYLLECAQQQRSRSFKIQHTQQELADQFGVTRPALSRTIRWLVGEGIVQAERNNFSILKENALKETGRGVR